MRDDIIWDIPAGAFPWKSSTILPDASLRDVRRDLLLSMTEGQERECPCCGRRVAVALRTFSSAQARFLVKLCHHYYTFNTPWVRYTELGYTSRDYTAIRYHDLARPQTRHEDDDSRTDEFGGNKDGNGLWTPTARGVDFVLGRLEVPRGIVTYYGRVIGVTQEKVSIHNIRGDFDYDETVKSFPVPGTPFWTGAQ